LGVNGYMGALLFVDLTSGAWHDEPLDHRLCRDFLGGYGLGARILYERMPAKADPLGPDNMLGFVTGPFTGTPAISSGRFTVVGKSPLTGGWGDANAGGSFGPYLRFSGYDAVFFTGVSDRPVYLLLDDGVVSVEDAGELWGKDCLETDDLLKARHGAEAQIACIGPAGEKRSLLSCVITDKGRAAARSGLGAVMGSKHLKAVVVKGGKQVPVADPAAARMLRTKWARQLQGEGVIFKVYGTTVNTRMNTMAGDTPVKNWLGIYPRDFGDENLDRIDETSFQEERAKQYGCWHCHIRCGGHLKPKEGRAPVSHMPEYETIAMCGPSCRIDDRDAIIRFNDICNAYGLDTISAGAAVAFAMECYEQGIISRADAGMALEWGDAEAMVALTGMMARREGIGAALADGVAVAAKQFGGGAAAYAVHAGGQEIPAHDPRCYPSLALTYRLDPTPGRHSRGGSSWIAGLGLSEMPPDKYDYAHIGESHQRATSMCHVMASVGTCLFAYTSTPTAFIPEFLTAITGDEHDFGTCLRIGDRITLMRHLFNLREGVNPLTIEVNQRVLRRFPTPGPLPDVDIDEHLMIADYYRWMDWDLETSMPSRSRLEDHGLAELVDRHGES
jgi:aldehyde:ferredoxin oxidoreductase